MTTIIGTPTTTPPAAAPRAETPPGHCRRCGNPTRTTYVAAGDRVVPGLWTCTHCPEGRRAWPPDGDYRCG